MEILPALPQGPVQNSLPIVEVYDAAGASGPISKIEGTMSRIEGNSPDIEMKSVTLMVTFPPWPLLAVTVLMRPAIISKIGVVTMTFPAFPWLPEITE